MATQYTRGQITSEAEDAVNNTSLGTVSDAYMNRILTKLYTEYEWGFLLGSAVISFSAGLSSAALPTDYIAHFDMKYRDSNGTETALRWIEFSDYQMITVPSTQGQQPTYYTISPAVYQTSSGAVGNIKIWPTFQTAGSTVMTYYQMPTLPVLGTSGDATIPRFHNGNYLVDCLVNELYGYMRDPRYIRRYVEQSIGEVRANMRDWGNITVPTVGLDPFKFRSHNARRG